MEELTCLECIVGGYFGAGGEMPRRASNESAQPNPMDVHVGSRVRLRRTLMGMSQSRLGEAVGLTFQQVQKYERGANRIGAGRLFDFAQILDVPISFFFDDAPEKVGGTSDRPINNSDPPDPKAMMRRETLELVRAYYRVTDPKIRRRISELVKAMGGDEPSENGVISGAPYS
jgi:transcriptional regulator with XRE-family HTH domain